MLVVTEVAQRGFVGSAVAGQPGLCELSFSLDVSTLEFLPGSGIHIVDLDLLSNPKAPGVVVVWAVLCGARSWAFMVLVGLSRSGYLFCASVVGAELVLADALD